MLNKEIGYEKETGKYKIGDGIREWNALPYPQEGVGNTTPNGGEIFNDYDNNAATLYAHAEGHNTQAISEGSHSTGIESHAGSKAFKIAQSFTNNGTGTVVFNLNTVEGLSSVIGNSCTLRVANEFSNNITIESIDTTNKTITLAGVPESAKYENEADSPNTHTVENYIVIHNHPELGDIDIGHGAYAGGYKTYAQGRESFVTGRDNKVVGQYGAAFGRKNIVGYGAFASGRDNTAVGDNSHAEGYGTHSEGATSHSEGISTNAIGKASHAEGINTKTISEGSHASGRVTYAGSKAFKIAQSFTNNGSGTVTFKLNTINGLKNVIGKSCTLRVANEFSNGITIASINTANNTVTLTGVPSEAKYETLADDPNTHTIENYIVVHGYPELGDTDIGHNAYAGGYKNYAQGRESFVTGRDNKVVGQYGAAFGRGNIASGYSSHAEGYNTAASGFASHSEGTTGTTASGHYSHAEGGGTTALGAYSHAEGIGTTAEGYSSHAEGIGTTASGYYSHAEGDTTIAEGYSSHAEGDTTIASGEYSHAEGRGTIASRDYSHAEGSYNIIDTNREYLYIVGNGTSDEDRSNAHTLDWDGNAWYAGSITAGVNTTDDDNDLVLVTKGYLKQYIAEIIESLKS